MSICPPELTFRLTRGPDGWWTAQVAERPEAISQGETVREVSLNVIEALFEVLADELVA